MPHTDKHQNFNHTTIDRLNELLSLLAEVCDVPSALVMRLHPHEIEVLASAPTASTPYKLGDKEELNSGLYCEYVIAKRSLLVVPDATVDPDWNKNPDIKLGMISYLGYPLSWPDGKIFGTICILDNKSNAYSERIQQIVNLFKQLVEDQLALLYETQRSHDALAALQANRHELSQAVRLAVDTTARSAKMIKNTSKSLSSVLGDLAQLLDSTHLDEGNFKDLKFQDFQAQIATINDRILSLSSELADPAEPLYKNRTH